MKLLWEYGLKTDIVFSRPNYCKIDLMVENDRGGQLFMQGDEVEHLRQILKQHGIESGLKELIGIAEQTGEEFGQRVSATCDAKYLEVGISCKSDNVDVFLERFKAEGITAEDCSFWGDEFVEIEHECMSYMEVTALCTQRNQKQVISLTCLLSKENARRRLLCLVEVSIHF